MYLNVLIVYGVPSVFQQLCVEATCEPPGPGWLFSNHSQTACDTRFAHFVFF